MNYEYPFTKEPVASDRLMLEIKNSAITIALEDIRIFGSQLTIVFKAELSNAEETLLLDLVIAHTGIPLPEEHETVTIEAMPDPLPFAQPTFRTKRAAIAEIVEVAPGDLESSYYVLPADRYISGGTLLVKNAQFGDYVTAEVIDILEVIPEAYRANLCEAWPVVAQYIEKEFVEVSNGINSTHKICSYPLNAKITTGLALRLVYHAINAGVTRQFCINYNLCKKL